jgi:ABC-2 type transport system ATP-binding protein
MLETTQARTDGAPAATRDRDRGDPAEIAIRVRGLRKSYGGTEAVRGIDLDVRSGEIFAFLGPNGAGKTTTVEILEGFRAADAGEVSVLGRDPATAPSAWRERIGIVLQESAAEVELTVRECLELYAGLYTSPRPIPETLALVGLEGEEGKLVSRLSGGQGRRLDVALALIGDPELIFLDEPTTGFDPAARRVAWQMLAGLRELGKTIFLTTHYMEEAERLADRIAVIADGRIVDVGSPRTIGRRDHAASEIAFTLPTAVDPGQMPDELVDLLAAVERDRRVTLHSADPLADLERLAAWALPRGFGLEDLEVRRPTLEDVYLKLTTNETGSP